MVRKTVLANLVFIFFDIRFFINIENKSIKYHFLQHAMASRKGSMSLIEFENTAFK